MKKILLMLIFLFVISPSIVRGIEIKESDTFREGKYINGAYLIKEWDGKRRYQQSLMFLNSDGVFAYCLEPRTVLDEGIANQYISDPYNSSLVNLSASQINRINEISYFGYGYKNGNIDRTNELWYSVTQRLIWETADSSVVYYFTDTLNGNRTDKFDSWEQEILNDVNNYEKKPTLIKQNQTYMTGVTNIMYDFNYVLSNYYISDNGGYHVSITSDNKLKFYSDSIGNGYIKIRRSLDNNLNKPLYYANSDNQNMLIRGNLDEEYTINVTNEFGSIKINKKDSDTGSFNSNLSETVIGLYDSKMNLIGKYPVDDNGNITIDNLTFVKYYIKEESTNKEYVVDDTTYLCDLFSEKNCNIDIINKKISNDIIIHKYHMVEGNIIDESNITFELYQDDVLIDKYTTDDNGIINLNLNYGDYVLKQVNSIDGYDLVDDTYISVRSDGKVQKFELENKIKNFNFVINKKDLVTDKVIDDLFMFKIYSDDGKFVDVIEVNGTYSLNLNYGKYYLKEISSPDNYELGNEVYEIFLDKDMTLDIYNDQIKKNIKVIKIDDEGNLLDNIRFYLYADDDVYFNNDLIYKKNSLIDTYVTSDGCFSINDLVYGKYYLVEDDVSGYQKHDKIYFEVLDNTDQEITVVNYQEKIYSYEDVPHTMVELDDIVINQEKIEDVEKYKAYYKVYNAKFEKV